MNQPTNYHEGRFPPETLDLDRLTPLIGPANAALARYDGMLAAIPNANVLLSPLTTQEAVLSSRIEGTQSTMGEVLEYEAKGGNGDPENAKEADIVEVLNYRRALNHATNMLEDLPLSQRVILQSHELLLDGVRGHGKSPGAYRKIPNWIGSRGAGIESARYVPIGADKLPDAMSRWEKYMHRDDTPDRLIQLSLLHAEFEALHPFLDGNGRLGRMLIPLFLFSTGLVRRPVFYISAYLESNRDDYYERLLAVSRDSDWSGWCAFFLEAMRIQAEDNLAKTKAILDLYDQMKPQIMEWTNSRYAIQVLDWIFKRPIFKSADLAKAVGASATKKILKILKAKNILKEVIPHSGRRAAILIYPTLLNIAEGRDAFRDS